MFLTKVVGFILKLHAHDSLEITIFFNKLFSECYLKKKLF